MLNISGIHEGFVLDHIQAGMSLRIYNDLKLDQLDCTVAIIKNAKSNKMGKKDIIKVDSSIDINLELIGFVSPNATVNIIRDGERIDKKHIALPDRLVNMIRCKNPRCITTTEQEITHIFVRSEAGDYRCLYCETKATGI